MAAKKEANPSTTKKPEARRSTTQPESSESKPEAVESRAFHKAKSKAEEYAQDPQKAKKLVDEAMKKAKGKKQGALEEVWKYLGALIRLTRAYFNRQYTEIPWHSIVVALAALIYFVSPLDFIPDVIPVLGLSDDAVIISFVVAQIKTDLDDFMAWEISRQDKVNWDPENS